LAKISYAAEIVLCTQHEQSMQDSSKLHLYLRLHSFEVLCHGTWLMPCLLWPTAPSSAGSLSMSAWEIYRCRILPCTRRVS